MTSGIPKVTCVARARIPTVQGPDIFLHLYSNELDNKEHLAIVFGETIRSRSLFRQRKGESQQERMIRGAYAGRLYPGRTVADYDERLGIRLKFDEDDGELIAEAGTTWDDDGDTGTLVRLHSECYTGETAWSARCDCGEQFERAGRMIGESGSGVIVYLRQEGRGIGLGEKLKAYNLQDLGADTVQANLLLKHPVDGRDFSLGRAILVDLGIKSVRLLTNNPQKLQQVHCPPLLTCVERVPMIPLSWIDEVGEAGQEGGIRSKEVDAYLRVKVEQMGHLLQAPLRLHTREEAEEVVSDQMCI